jgi:hypothetical protein
MPLWCHLITVAGLTSTRVLRNCDRTGYSQTIGREEPNALMALPRGDDHLMSKGNGLNFQ